MKKLILIASFFCGITCMATSPTATVHTSYYVSSSGDNTTGLSPSHAFRTIDKLNASWTPIVGGDSILFNAGEEFHGEIIVQKNGVSGNPIVFGRYGVGADPIVTGLVTITGWINLGGNIWEAPTPGALMMPNLVVRNGVPQQIGRTPNTNGTNGGYYVITSGTSTSLLGNALSTTTNWNNAEVVVRWARWATLRRHVTSHSGGTITFASLGQTPRANYGYFFQRDPRTLDQDGEWYQDSINNKLRMYFANNNPSAYTIRMSNVDTLFYNRRTDITVTNINFVGANRCAVMNNGGSRILMEDANSDASGGEGFVSWFATNVTIQRCSTYNNLGGGIRLFGAGSGTVNLVANSNVVRNSAVITGMEISGLASGARGIFIRGGDNITASYNKVINSGYNGMEWQGNNVLIYRNYVDSFCTGRDDGGGIYTYEGPGKITTVRSNRVLRSNIVINGIGAPYGVASLGTDPESILGQRSVSGVYNDEGSKNIVIDSNTIANIPFHAIQGNNNQNITITNNVVYNCAISVAEQRLDVADRMINFVIKNNTFYPSRYRIRDQGSNKPTVQTQTQVFQSLGVIDSSFYSTKTGLDTSVIIQTADSGGGNFQRIYKNYAYIVGTLAREVHSINKVNTGILLYNNTLLLKTTTFAGLSKKDLIGNVYNNSIAIPTFQSKVLLDNGVLTTENLPPNVDAGADSTITLPTNSVHLIGTANDFDGTIVSTAWSKLSGPSSNTIVSPSSLTTLVQDLVEGIYQFQIIATDNGGLKDTSIVIVTVNPAVVPANLPPTADAGADQSWSYTTTSVTLTAVGTDPESGPLTYSWIKTVGTGSTIVSPSAATTVINGLTPGTFIYQVTVTDNLGATAIDNVRVIITAAPGNVPPLIVFPENIVIQAPIDTARLSISATDTDGSIVSYLWTGGVGTIVNPTDSTTLVTGLTEGTHTYTVTITDNDGATSSADITITVVAIPQQPKYLLNFKVYPNN